MGSRRDSRRPKEGSKRQVAAGIRGGVQSQTPDPQRFVLEGAASWQMKRPPLEATRVIRTQEESRRRTSGRPPSRRALSTARSTLPPFRSSSHRAAFCDTFGNMVVIWSMEACETWRRRVDEPGTGDEEAVSARFCSSGKLRSSVRRPGVGFPTTWQLAHSPKTSLYAK